MQWLGQIVFGHAPPSLCIPISLSSLCSLESRYRLFPITQMWPLRLGVVRGRHPLI